MSKTSQVLLLFLALFCCICYGPPPSWFVDAPFQGPNPDSLCFDTEGYDNNVGLVEIPADPGFPANWPADAQGKRRIGFYYSTGRSNGGLKNFKNAWFPFSGVQVQLEVDNPRMGLMRKFETPNKMTCELDFQEDQRPLWRKKWDEIADSNACPTNNIYINGGIMKDDVLVDLTEKEGLDLYKRMRRHQWANKFSDYWQIEISVACGTPTITNELRDVMFPNDPNPRRYDPSFDEIPYLVRRWKWDARKKTFVKRPKGREHDLVCQLPITYDVPTAALHGCNKYGPGLNRDLPKPRSLRDIASPKGQQWVFELYRTCITLNQWMARHGALIVKTTTEFNALPDELKIRTMDETSFPDEAAAVKTMIDKGGPTSTGNQSLLGRGRVLRPRVNVAPPLPGDQRT